MEENKIKPENISKDIEYIKSLAEAGDKKPIPFAKVIFFASLVYLIYDNIGNMIFHFFTKIVLNQYMLKVLPNSYENHSNETSILDNLIIVFYNNLIPISFGLFIIGAIIWRKYLFSKGETSNANKAAISIWIGVIIFIITRHYSVYLLLNNPENVRDTIAYYGPPPIGAQTQVQIDYWKWWMKAVPMRSQVPNFLMISSLGWWVTADMSAYKWTKLLAVSGFMFALVFSYYRTAIMFTPLYSVGFTVFYFILIPSAILMWQQARMKN